MIGCNKITIEDLIDWKKLENIIYNSKVDDVCLIGGENPLNLCNGHRNIYKNLNKIVISSGKTLSVVTNHIATYNTDILNLFDYLHIFIPKNWKKDKLTIVNTLYLKSYVGINTYIEVEKLNEDVLYDIRTQFFKNPIILLKGKERQRIKEYLNLYGGFGFASQIIKRKYPIYSLTENEYYKHSYNKSSIPWRDLLKVD